MPEIIEAFRAVSRRDFLTENQQVHEADDRPLPIGYGQTNSQPSTVALMLELLQPQSGETILDVGAGSGWTTALLAHIVGAEGRVYGVELIKELVTFGSSNLARYNFSNADIRQTGKALGLPEQGPFDGIIVSAAAQRLPYSLVEQLNPEGRIVLPVEESLLVVRKTASGEITTEEYPGFAFVPLHMGDS